MRVKLQQKFELVATKDVITTYTHDMITIRSYMYRGALP